MSSPYRHILIATDGSRVSEEAARAGIALARAAGSRLTVLHVMADVDERPLESWAHGDAQFAAKLLRSLEARERDCDLIVMASHGRKGGPAESETLRVAADAGIPVLAHHSPSETPPLTQEPHP